MVPVLQGWKKEGGASRFALRAMQGGGVPAYHCDLPGTKLTCRAKKDQPMENWGSPQVEHPCGARNPSADLSGVAHRAKTEALAKAGPRRLPPFLGAFPSFQRRGLAGSLQAAGSVLKAMAVTFP